MIYFKKNDQMFCGQCGKEISESSKFCNFCGANQLAVEESKNLKQISEYSMEEFCNFSTAKARKLIQEQIDLCYYKDKFKSEYIKDVILFDFDQGNYDGAIYRQALHQNLINIEKNKLSEDDLLLQPKFKEEKRKKNSSSYRYLKIARNQYLTCLLIDLFLFWNLVDFFPFLDDSNPISTIVSIGVFSLISWLLVLIYFAPWSIAWARRHPSAWGILIINLFLSWTFIAWVIALIWATSQIEQRVVIKNE